MMTPREQGDFGERSAVCWLLEQGAYVAFPFGHSSDWDLLAEVDGRILRVQVKTSGQHDKARWSVMVCTRGGNQSWNGVAKYFDPARCDYLFVHVGDGRRWFIPSTALGGRAGIRLGGPKYAQFEIEPGQPFQERRARRLSASTIAA